MMAISTVERGLPANVDAERFVLGSVLMDESLFVELALSADDFCLEKHRRIWLRMEALHARQEQIDRVTVANELMAHGQIEAVGGLSYLVSLDDGLPAISNLASYARIVKEKAEKRRLILNAQKLLDQALMDDDRTAAELASEASEHLLDFADITTNSEPESIPQIVAKYGGLDGLLAVDRNGIQTGFSRFDEMTGGLHPGELIIIAARPSMGKTALAMNIADSVAARGYRVAVFSLEMSKQALVTRMLCSRARVNAARQRAGFLDEADRKRLMKAAAEYDEMALVIDDTPSSGIMDIHAKLRRIRARQGLHLVIVDYLQLMSGKGENRNQEVGALSRGFKLLAKELNVPMVVLSQLSRASETRAGDHRPQMSDLRDSGSIEQDADVVGFIFREEVYKPDHQELKGLAELLVRKQRTGPIGTVPLTFLHQYTRFESRQGGPVEAE